MNIQVDLLISLLTPVLFFMGIYLAMFLYMNMRKEAKQTANDRKLRYTADFLRDECKEVFPREAFTTLSPDEMFSEDFQGQEKQLYRKEIIQYMNSMELLSYLVNSGVLDEELVKGFRRSALISSFFQSHVFIVRLRERGKSARAYNEWEALARRWEDDVRGGDFD